MEIKLDREYSFEPEMDNLRSDILNYYFIDASILFDE